ncbi:hypothetical protein QUF64_14420 [Anaerolineales bacterium HSG6]|nr:hypothetical protein [Anaerolineales bacterium HSG6]MDM8531664.1 hypothetical protein [Anaerolineales bacterium HSG25]
MGLRLRVIIIATFLVFGCSTIPGVEVVPRPKTEIIDTPPEVVSTVLPADAVAATAQVQPVAEVVEEATATPTNTPVILPTATPAPYLAGLSTNSNSPEALPWHGVFFVFMALTCIMAPWGMAQIWYIRFAQPHSFDITEVLIKAQDGLFVTVVLSMTARRSFTFTALYTSWPRIKEIVSKTLEEALIDEGLNYPTLDELQPCLKDISAKFIEQPIVQELWTDFGIRVMRFNIETRYPQETIDALNRKAEANAGGQAYLEYARAAHLDPNSQESRELYRVYQETRGQVDAARNLGGGITSLANILGQKVKSSGPTEDSNE